MFTGYKAALFGALLVVFGALQGLDWAALISDPQMAGWIVSAIGVVVIVLRAFTTTPIFTKKD